MASKPVDPIMAASDWLKPEVLVRVQGEAFKARDKASSRFRPGVADSACR